jgi:hypothetical protein
MEHEKDRISGLEDKINIKPSISNCDVILIAKTVLSW